MIPRRFIATPNLLPPPPPPRVKARLVSGVESVEPGSQLCVALALTMEEGWHIYWKNPGDSGLPTSIQWNLPEGFSVEETKWPYPQRFETSGIVSFGYAGELVYNGGIDDIRSAMVDDIAKAKNYFRAALEELLSGQEVSVKTSQPYGCSVKYKN